MKIVFEIKHSVTHGKSIRAIMPSNRAEKLEVLLVSRELASGMNIQEVLVNEDSEAIERYFKIYEDMCSGSSMK